MARKKVVAEPTIIAEESVVPMDRPQVLLDQSTSEPSAILPVTVE